MNLEKTFSLKTKNSIDEKNYTIAFIAISNKPILRKRLDGSKYYISINTNSMDFKAENFYLDHDVSFEKVIGKIERSKIDEEGNIKVIVKFYEDIKLSHEAFLKYKNNLCDCVSIGIGECEFKEVEPIDGIKHFCITKGEIIELSAVWKGADPRAKVSNFSKDSKENHLNQQSNIKGELMQNPQTKEKEIKEILKLAEILGNPDLGIEAIKKDMNYEEFSNLMLKSSKENKGIKQNMKDIGVDYNHAMEYKKDITYSLANYAKSVFSGKNIGEIEFKEGSNGYIIPNSFYSRFEVSKTQDNNAIISTIIRTDKFIENLLAKSNILGMCDVLTGLSGNISIPKDTSYIQAYWVKEGESTTTSKITTDKINLTPATIKAKIKVTRQMLGMSAISLESYIIHGIQEAIKQKLELDLLYGEGNDASPIKGVFNIDGVNSISNFFTSINYENTLEFAAKIAQSNLNLENTCFLANSKTMTKLQTTPLDAQARNSYLLNQERDYLAGYRFIMNNLIKDNHIVFGDFKNIIVGAWGSLQVLATRDEEGDLTFTGFYDLAAGVKTEKAFVIAKS